MANNFLSVASLFKEGPELEFDDKHVIIKTNQSAGTLFPVIFDVDNPLFFNLLEKCAEANQELIDMAAARGAFICQSQSLNLFVADPNYAKLTSMHFYGWKKGLKTGIYYLRTRAPVMAQKFTIDPELQKAAEKSEHDRIIKKYEADEGCVMCSS